MAGEDRLGIRYSGEIEEVMPLEFERKTLELTTMPQASKSTEFEFSGSRVGEGLEWMETGILPWSEGASAGYHVRSTDQLVVSWAFPWSENQDGSLTIVSTGISSGDLAPLLASLQSGDRMGVFAWLEQQRNCFGVIIHSEDWLFAATDRVTGFPILFKEGNGERLEISTDTRIWQDRREHLEFNPGEPGSFLRAGYCLGSKTLFKGYRRMLPGEACFFDFNTGELDWERFFFFRPSLTESTVSSVEWEERLEVGLRSSCQRVIDAVNGGTIWIPLSAGYDSRVVLAGMIDRGYDDVRCFSYGSPGNMEARVAREIADQAGVPWEFVDSTADCTRSDFEGDEGSSYLQYAGGFGSTPAFTEYAALRQMAESRTITNRDIIVNGQSGDFLTGGHVPRAKSQEELVEAVHCKHFGLFPMIAEYTIEETRRVMESWMEQFAGSHIEDMELPGLLSAYLAFECQERQSRYVVNQHRAYDFLGLRWMMPLWDADLMDLFEEAPLSELEGQALYLRYLRKWNPKGLFDEMRKPYDPWMRRGWFVRNAGRFAGLFGLKDEVYRSLYYFSDLNYMYRLFGFAEYLKKKDQIRGVTSLFALAYIDRISIE